MNEKNMAAGNISMNDKGGHLLDMFVSDTTEKGVIYRNGPGGSPAWCVSDPAGKVARTPVRNTASTSGTFYNMGEA